MADITSANAVFLISIFGLYNSPQQLQGFAVDDAFDTGASKPAEVMKGVDGRMSYGYTPFMTEQTIALMADSPSAAIFDEWITAQKTTNSIYPANATIILPSVSRKYAFTNGVMTSIIAVSGAKKLLEARRFVITWDDISPAPF